MTSVSTTPHVGSVLADRYELARHIARGGMGDVYEAQDRVLRRAVAVKVFRSASPTDRARFDAEVRVLAGLDHHGLVRVYDAGAHGDDAFVVLELIDGPSLAACLREGATLPPNEVAGLGASLADALAYIHERGVVHRDVTPSNVLCDPEGRPRLVDFGIARLLDAPRITTTSLTVGTPSYMAPEQLQGGAVTPAADVYALGLVLLEALTGRRAFPGTVHETAMARLASGPDLPPDLPGGWRTLLTEMTHRQPATRPSAASIRDRLRALDQAAAETTAPVADVDAPTQELPAGGGTQVMPVPVPLVEDATLAPVPIRHRRRPWLAVGLVAAGAVAALALVALAAGDGTEGEDPPATTVTVAQEEPRQEQTQVTEPPTTTLPPATTVPPETVPPETTLPAGFPFEPDTQPPGLERQVEDEEAPSDGAVPTDG